MAILVWLTTAIALWHFTVLIPDKIWGGIVGALLGAVAGGMITGLLGQLATGDGVGETSILTVLAAVPGVAIAIAIMYAIGSRDEDQYA